jgi:hypothetical protein
MNEELLAMARELGRGVNAAVVMGLANDPQFGDPVAWMNLSGTAGQSLAALFSGVSIERSYLDSVMGFAEPEPPAYEGSIELGVLRKALALEKVMCVLVMTSDGRVLAGRNYDGVEMTRLEVIESTFRMFENHLAGRCGYALVSLAIN